MSNPNAPASGLPPPPVPLATQSQQRQHKQQQQQQQLLQQQQQQHHQVPLQHSYASRLITSPHTLQSSSPTHFVQPHNPSHQYSSSYSSGSPAVLQQPADQAFFNAHPSPYSTNSVAGSYTSSEPNEAMAQATMSRQAYPPISSYHTPQSNSPASMHSPQHDASGRMYAVPSMAQPMYYSHAYSMHQPSQYGQQSVASTAAHHHLPSSTSLNVQYQPQQHHLQHAYQPSNHHQQQALELKSSQQPPQRSLQATTPLPLSSQNTSSQHPQQPPTPLQSQPPQTHAATHTQTGSSVPDMTLGSSAEPVQAAAPGPIPATTPQIVAQDQNGVQWIAFDYSRDRVKMQYTIRCDVESVDEATLTDQFKTANCVYPRACEPIEKYKGNRRQYETECNSIGWALATLNAPLREKRGLIQRAVDSWRNSNRNLRFRSRRVRRQNKMDGRASRGQSVHPPTDHNAYAAPAMQQPLPQLQQHPSMAMDSRSAMVMQPHGVQQVHQPNDGSEARGSVGASVDSHYSSSSAAAQVPSNGLPSPSSLRQAHSFYPSYPQMPHIDAASMSNMQGGIGLSSVAPLPTHATSLPMTSQGQERKHQRLSSEGLDSGRVLHGNLPAKKRPKFVIVNDFQRGDHMRVRVKANIDAVNVDEIPDTYLTSSATYPRSCQPRQTRSPAAPLGGNLVWDDDDDGLLSEQRGRTFVPVTLLDGSDAQLPAPRLTRARRNKEVLLNQLGHRMTWAQVRTFNGRKLFLQHSLDAYRGKVHRELNNMSLRGQELPDDEVPQHFEVRPGKRRFTEYQEQRRQRSK